MIQEKNRRKSKNEVHICEFCKKKAECNIKPPTTEWKDVLTSCQFYDEIEIDFFTGGHSR